MDDEPRLSPELVGALVTAMDGALSTQEMALREARVGVMQSEEGSCQGPFPSFSPTVTLMMMW